jgi:hypothetical protein
MHLYSHGGQLSEYTVRRRSSRDSLPCPPSAGRAGGVAGAGAAGAARGRAGGAASCAAAPLWQPVLSGWPSFCCVCGGSALVAASALHVEACCLPPAAPAAPACWCCRHSAVSRAGPSRLLLHSLCRQQQPLAEQQGRRAAGAPTAACRRPPWSPHQGPADRWTERAALGQAVCVWPAQAGCWRGSEQASPAPTAHHQVQRQGVQEEQRRDGDRKQDHGELEGVGCWGVVHLRRRPAKAPGMSMSEGGHRPGEPPGGAARAGELRVVLRTSPSSSGN